MVGPDQSRFHQMTPELADQFLKAPLEVPEAQSPTRNWTRFDEGETVFIKGVGFRVHEIGETRMVLKLINA
jgi:hypothetical protein